MPQARLISYMSWFSLACALTIAMSNANDESFGDEHGWMIFARANGYSSDVPSIPMVSQDSNVHQTDLSSTNAPSAPFVGYLGSPGVQQTAP